MKTHLRCLLLGIGCLTAACKKGTTATIVAPEPLVFHNPLVTKKFTADPAVLVYNNTMYLYAGHDEASESQNQYVMNEWLCYSSSDLATWTEQPVPLRVSSFAWARADAWASQVIERNGRFYWYAAVDHRTVPGKAIGVAVANSPAGPLVDARGTALITNNMTNAVNSSFDDIDPTVFIDPSGQAYLYWGNSACYYAKLNANMTDLAGPIQTISLPNYTEAPWVHRRGKWYYLSYATEFPERIAYAMSRSPEGPWVYKGILNELASNCNTNHQAIIDFKGKWYFVYHNGTVPTGGNFRRSVCMDYLNYNADSTMQKVMMTAKGVDPVQ